MIEKKSRRMELALYCFARAIESFAICVTDWGLLERYNLIPPKRIDVFLFSAATAIIMHCYAQERDVFRSKYLNVLDWVFGLPNGAKPYTPTPPTRATSSENKVLPLEQASGPITDDSRTGIATSSGIVLASQIWWPILSPMHLVNSHPYQPAPSILFDFLASIAHHPIWGDPQDKQDELSQEHGGGFGTDYWGDTSVTRVMQTSESFDLVKLAFTTLHMWIMYRGQRWGDFITTLRIVWEKVIQISSRMSRSANLGGLD
jgi:hypothetical protein